jgi:hypothetical protein
MPLTGRLVVREKNGEAKYTKVEILPPTALHPILSSASFAAGRKLLFSTFVAHFNS